MRYIPGLEHFSCAAVGKHAVKTIINNFLDVGKKISERLDKSDHQGNVHGHDHMGGFKVTPEGKLIADTGCCTEHVQFMAHDPEGNWGLIEWHPGSGITIKDEYGNEQVVTWKELGLSLSKQPLAYEDEALKCADRAIRILQRVAPPLGGLEPELTRIKELRKIRDSYDWLLLQGEIPTVEQVAAYRQARRELAQRDDRIRYKKEQRTKHWHHPHRGQDQRRAKSGTARREATIE